jgi:hypothetical protein
MRLGLVEELGVEARLFRQPDGRLCLAIYCSQCRAGIVLLVLAAADTAPSSKYDWQSDGDVRSAIEYHRQKHVVADTGS